MNKEKVCDKLTAREAAEKALKTLTKEELIYQHYGDICAHEKAFDRLAELFETYAVQQWIPKKLEIVYNKLKKAQDKWCKDEDIDDPEDMWNEIPELLDEIVPIMKEILDGK